MKNIFIAILLLISQISFSMENINKQLNENIEIKNTLDYFIKRLESECTNFSILSQYTALKKMKKFEKNEIDSAVESVEENYRSLDKKCLNAIYTNSYEWFKNSISDDRENIARDNIKMNIAMLNITLLDDNPNLTNVLINLEESFKLSIQSNILSKKELNINFYSPNEQTAVHLFMDNFFFNIKLHKLYNTKDESIIKLIDFIKPYSDLTIRGYENKSGDYEYDGLLSINKYLICQRNSHYRNIIIKQPLTLKSKKYLIEQTNELEKKLKEDIPDEFGHIQTSICELYDTQIINIIEENKQALEKK